MSDRVWFPYLRVTPLLVIGLVAGACSDEPIGVDPPVAVQAQYVLTSANGQSMPVSIDVFGQEDVTFTVLADTIRLLEGDLWERRVTHVRERTTGNADLTGATIFVEGFVRMDGAVSVLDFVCPDGSLCVAPERAIVAGAELHIEKSTLTGLEDLLYLRR